MEKPPQFKSPEINEKGEDKPAKLARLSNLFKALMITAGMAATHPSFGQNSENGQGANKTEYKTEVLQDIATYYHKLAEKSKNSLDYLKYEKLSAEDSILLEREIKKDISLYKNIEENPNEHYKKSVEIVNNIKSELISYYSSPDFLNKLKTHLNIEEAMIKQNALIENLKSVSVCIVSPDTITKLNKSAAALYKIKEHKIFVPFTDYEDEAIAHELIHSAYRADKLIDEGEQKILWRQYKHNKKVDNKYQRDPAERIARVEQAIIELKTYPKFSGIINDGEKFNKTHYGKIIEMKNQNQLDFQFQDLLNTTNEKQFIKLMNEIADAGKTKDLKDSNLA